MYNDLVMNTMHLINEKAKLRGFANGIAWAKAAFEAGELTDNELIELGAFHNARNNMAHGQAGKISFTEEDYSCLLKILSKFDKSQLRGDSGSGEEGTTERATPEEIEEWYSKGKECYESMQYEEAVKYYRQAVAQGHCAAQNNLGVCYETGQGVPKDIAMALQLYQKSAEQGNPVAQCNLGVLFFYGSKVKKDWFKAVSMFQAAAEQGDARAQYYLAECYFWGKGVKKDDKEAFQLYKKAAEQKMASAMGRLGDCYYDGTGVERDYKKAFFWYEKGAKKNDSTSLNGLANCYYYSHGVEEDEENFDRYEWPERYYTKAANDGNPFARLHLACISQEYYDSHNNGGQDAYARTRKEEADKWRAEAEQAFEARLQNGSAEEYYTYACIFYNSKAWHQDPHCQLKAYEGKWVNKAAELGHVDAMTVVGIKLISIQGYHEPTREEEKKGRQMLLAASKQGSVEAMSHLGVNYIQSQLLPTDQTEGCKWLLRAEMRGYSIPASVASHLEQFLEEGQLTSDLMQELRECSEQGYASASEYLYHCYENGYGVEKDEQEARRYLQLAADQGDDKSRRILAAYHSATDGNTEALVAAAKEIAKLIKAANRGNTIAQYELACCYEKGEGVEKDEQEAFNWYEKAAERGPYKEESTKMAHYKVGLAYERGICVEKDWKKAIGHYFYACGVKLPDEEAAELQYKVGHAYVVGDLGIRWKYAAAAGHLEVAAKLGHKQAKKELFGVRIMSLFEKLTK